MGLFFSRMRHDPPLLVLAAILLLWILAMFALPPLLAHDAYAASTGARLLPPSAEHLMGTDQLGRDLLARVLVGGQASLTVSIVSGVLSAVFGIGIGAAMAMTRGRVQLVCTGVIDFFLAFPSRVFLVALVGFLGPSVVNIILAILLTTWAEYARITRTIVRTEREKWYVRYADVSGIPFGRRLRSYVLPNVIPQMLVFFFQHLSEIILIVAGLSLIGIGIQPPTPEWGMLLMGAKEYMQTAPWLLMFPGAAIFVTVVIFSLMGDVLRDIFEPRWERGGKGARKV